MATLKIPAGSMICYTGHLDNTKLASLETKGWLLCDGSPYDTGRYPDLYKAIGSFHGKSGNTHYLPDMQGRFIRGVNGEAMSEPGRTVDPDVEKRSAPRDGGNSGNVAGSIQGYATGSPKTPFLTSDPGDHTHQLNHLPPDFHNAYVGALFVKDAGNEAESGTMTGEGGKHAHSVTLGGDSETAPVHMNLYYLIKHSN